MNAPLPQAALSSVQATDLAALPPGSPLTYRRQRGSGTNLGFGFVGDDIQWDIGATGVGFPVTNVVGGLAKTGTLGRYGYKLEAFRRPITGSLLSYAGARDPVSGELWGGVVATGAAGADVSTVTARDAPGPSLPAGSVALAVRLFTPSGKTLASITLPSSRWRRFSRSG